ncbi:hypothetical protein OnM2_023036 [Erysiphe neolycopersici]|uniref:Uncharacterized protein n=1 Tax=Erysiphe neolycopersici TaxID=212602 RepID=A0A420I1Z3_9PEZI|nr:hypothetical protein OnM2_023036 [Erysiphe neolycopersici]
MANLYTPVLLLTMQQKSYEQALNTYNQRPNSTGYSPTFLALGVTHKEPPTPYLGELTPTEETAFASDLFKLYSPKVQNAHLNVASRRAARDEMNFVHIYKKREPGLEFSAKTIGSFNKGKETIKENRSTTVPL